MRILLIFLVGMLSVDSALAWGPAGHMTVAEIAYERLSPKAKEESEKLLKVPVEPRRAFNWEKKVEVDEMEHTGTFVTSSCWADDVRSKDDAEWHYKDIPFSPDGTTPQLKESNGDVVEAINRCVETLKKATASDDEKAKALRYLVHFVGDIHQPLHCVTRCTKKHPHGDRGGNEFHIIGAKNLHYYWDDGVGLFPEVLRPLDADGTATISKLAKTISEEFPAATLTEQLGVTDPEKWAQEGQHLAVTVVYQIEENSEPSASYNERGRAVVRQRIALAGYRLADLLNAIFR